MLVACLYQHIFPAGATVSPARPLARPPARLPARSPARQPVHPVPPLARPSVHPLARTPSRQPTDKRRILSALMARSQKAFQTIHVIQAMWYPSPSPRPPAHDRQADPNHQPSHKIANLQAVWPTNNSLLCGRVVFSLARI